MGFFSKHHVFVVFFLLSFLFLASSWAALTKSPTWDEGHYIGSGLYVMRTMDLRTSSMMYHLPGAYYLEGLPLMFLDVNSSLLDSRDWVTASNVIFHSGYDPQLVLYLSRLPVIILSLVMGFLVFRWASRLYGVNAGLFALFLYCFNPGIIALSSVAMIDLVVAFFMFASIFLFVRFLGSWRLSWLLFACLFTGFAQVIKQTAVFLYPVFFALFAFDLFQKKAVRRKLVLAVLSFLLILAVSFFVVFAFLFFEFGTVKGAMPDYYSGRFYEELPKLHLPSPVESFFMHFFEDVRIPAPSYAKSMIYVLKFANSGFSHFFNGAIHETSPWYTVPLSFLLKNPLPLFAFILIGVVFFRKGGIGRDEFFLLFPAVFLFLVFMFNRMSDGYRMILPIYPLIFIYVSQIVNFRFERQKLYSAVLVALSVLYAISSILVAPHFLAYFNILAGGSGNGYNYFIGINYDSGQDLTGLKEYLADNNIGRVKFSYFGSVDPAEYGIDYEYLLSPYNEYWIPGYRFADDPDVVTMNGCTPTTGFIVVSATNLQNSFLANATCYDWLKQYEPVARIGYTIFVYNIT